MLVEYEPQSFDELVQGVSVAEQGYVPIMQMRHFQVCALFFWHQLETFVFQARPNCMFGWHLKQKTGQLSEDLISDILSR